MPSAHFRVLLLRRLRLQLPVAPRTCACRGHLDPLGDHRAALGVRASRALPLERAVARVCHEAGVRVARNVRLADMNIDVPVSDDRRIEVVANGLALRHGLQQAVDATIVLAKRSQGLPCPARPLRQPPDASGARRTAPGAAAWWSSGSRSVAFLAMKPPRGYVCWHSSRPPPFRRRCGQRRGQPGLHVGRGCRQLRRSAHLPRPSSSSHLPANAVWRGMRLSCTRSLPTCAGSSPYPPAVKDHADVPAVLPGACRGVVAGDQTLW